MKNRCDVQPWLVSLMVLLGGAGLVSTPAVAASVPQTQANVMIELPFAASRTYRDPFNDVTLDVTFIDPRGHELHMPAFWDGNNVWKVRYASPLVGTHRFHTDYIDPADTGLHDITGKVEISPYTGHNPLYLHGPLRLAANRRTLEHADGTPFFWLGDTWWMGLCRRLHWPDEFKALTADRVTKGFTVVQIVAGLYPDMPPFDPRGANEAGFPWEPDYARMRPEYFDAADKRLGHLVESGLTPCIVGAWGYFLPMMGVEKARQHWRYLVARYGAWPVVWCVAGEANLPYYRARGFPFDDRKQVKGWTEVTRYLRGMDPFHRLITIHPTGIGRLSARHATDDVSLLDIDMLQTPHGRRDGVEPTVRTMRQSYDDKPVLPVIDGEASYEMLGDNLPTMWTRRMFWLCMMNGAAGHTYGANGIWQCNRRGQPHGPSPTAGSPPTGYGVIPWDDAMNLPGSRQEGLGKKLLEQYKWQDFRPHPEWAAFSSKGSVTLEGCNWIWFPEGNPAQNAPAAKRYFRRSFELPQDKVVKRAQLRISADDRFAARLNGKAVGASGASEAESWRTSREFTLLAPLLKTGANVLAVEAENLPARTANPAGLIASLQIQFADGESIRIVSDTAWRAAKTNAAGWDTPNFDDAKWDKAMDVASYGQLPWGDIDQLHDNVYGPQSTGIPGVLRMIYVPESEPIVVSDLGSHAMYSATYFDPVSGEKTALPPAKADASGRWTCPPPAGHHHDWVLVLEEKHPT